MIDVGFCGLHNVHRAFRNGMEASEWNLAKLLKEAWQLFHDLFWDFINCLINCKCSKPSLYH